MAQGDGIFKFGLLRVYVGRKRGSTARPRGEGPVGAQRLAGARGASCRDSPCRAGAHRAEPPLQRRGPRPVARLLAGREERVRKRMKKMNNITSKLGEARSRLYRSRFLQVFLSLMTFCRNFTNLFQMMENYGDLQTACQICRIFKFYKICALLHCLGGFTRPFFNL